MCLPVADGEIQNYEIFVNVMAQMTSSERQQEAKLITMAVFFLKFSFHLSFVRFY